MRSGEEDNELLARNYSFFRTDGEDGRREGGTVILDGKTYDAQGSHKMNSPNMHSLEVSNATSGSRISVTGVYLSSASMSGGTRNCFSFPEWLFGLQANISFRRILTPMRMTVIARQLAKPTLGKNSCSWFTQIGWIDALPKQLSGYSATDLGLARTLNDKGSAEL